LNYETLVKEVDRRVKVQREGVSQCVLDLAGSETMTILYKQGNKSWF